MKEKKNGVGITSIRIITSTERGGKRRLKTEGG